MAPKPVLSETLAQDLYEALQAVLELGESLIGYLQQLRVGLPEQALSDEPLDADSSLEPHAFQQKMLQRSQILHTLEQWPVKALSEASKAQILPLFKAVERQHHTLEGLLNATSQSIQQEMQSHHQQTQRLNAYQPSESPLHTSTQSEDA
jgi:hypothetical protein